MGLDFSCPLASYCDLETVFQSFMVKSINLANNDISKGPVRSNSFNGSKPKSTFFQSEGCRKMRIESHVSLKITENETQVSIEAPFGKEIDFEKPKHEAAIKLQKVYKSFRTRRKLADCAVLIEPNWWKLLDFAELKRSSISFFEINKPETAVSRWSRAKTRAAKVGKGLSKNSRARKMALQHWLEAIDPRHRYGHNLHFYYVKWLHSQSKEPFFYWLDIGEGKELNLVEKCPRSKLQLQCIKYLGPMERMPFEVIVEDGKFLYKQSGELLDTREKTKGAKWIFVLSTSMSLYVGQKKKGFFQHSSFLAGGATSAAGRIVVENGILKAVWPHSGHYRPTPENFQDFISFLRGYNVDLADVKMNPDEVEEEEELSRKSNKVFLRSMSSEEDLSENVYLDIKELDSDAKNLDSTKILTNLSILDGEDGFFEEMEIEKKSGHENIITEKDCSDDEEEENKGDGSMEEAILKRINSHKEMNYSYQLGKQLSCKWTTGAGPRIGCMKDYPPKLQFHFLEKSNLSPRSCGGGGSHFRTFSSIDSDLQK